MLDETRVTSESKDSAGLNDIGGHCCPFSLRFSWSEYFSLVSLLAITTGASVVTLEVFGSFLGQPESGVLLELVVTFPIRYQAI